MYVCIGASLNTTRTIRFVSFFKSFIISLFSSTLIFGLLYPFADPCASYTTIDACTLAPSRLVPDLSQCIWELNLDIGYSKCYIRPPPNNLTFLLLVSTVSTLISLPIDLFLTLLLVTLCNKTPDWGRLRRRTSSDTDAIVMSAADAARHDKHSFAYILTALTLLKARAGSGTEKGAGIDASTDARRALNRALSELGVRFSGDSLRLSLWSCLFYSSVEACVLHRVRRARLLGLDIAKQLVGLSDDAQLKENILLQYFAYEKLGSLTTRVLKPHLNQFTSRVPILIHPLAWLAGWITVFALILFFIVWVLQWGFRNSGVTFTSWVVSFVMETVWGCLVSSTARVFIVHVLMVVLLRPRVVSTVESICLVSEDLASYEQEVDATYISRSLSPVCFAAANLLGSDRRLKLAMVLARLSDSDHETITVGELTKRQEPSLKLGEVPVPRGSIIRSDGQGDEV